MKSNDWFHICIHMYPWNCYLSIGRYDSLYSVADAVTVAYAFKRDKSLSHHIHLHHSMNNEKVYLEYSRSIYFSTKLCTRLIIDSISFCRYFFFFAFFILVIRFLSLCFILLFFPTPTSFQFDTAIVHAYPAN